MTVALRPYQSEIAENLAAACPTCGAPRICPTCGATPCANPQFCALCDDADRRKARGEKPRYSTTNRPIDWSESEHTADLHRLMADDVSLDRAWDEINRAARERHNRAPQPTVEALMFSLRE